MALTAKQIDDLVLTTLDDLGRLRFTQIAQQLVRYDVMKRVMRKDRVRFEPSGTGIRRNVMVTTSGAARNVGLFEEDVVNIADAMKFVEIPWKHTTVPWAYELREFMMNREPSRIVDLVATRRTDAMLSLAAKMELDWWSAPANTEDKAIMGVPYWIVKHATEGFHGGIPTGFSDVAGLSPTTYPTWANYTFHYTAVTKPDIIKKLRKMFVLIQFESPVDVPDYREGRGDVYRFYLNYSLLSDLEDLGEAANENLGRDLAPMDGTISFRRCPLVYTPQLDADTTNPIYALDLSVFQPVILKGDNLRETGPEAVAHQHNTRAVWVDLTWNVLCCDRRRCAVGYYAA